MESGDSSTGINGFLVKHDRKYIVTVTTEDDPMHCRVLQINPFPRQSFSGYFCFLYFMLGIVFMNLLVCLRYDIIANNQSPFDINGLFMITSIVAFSVAVVVSGVMVFAYYFLQMKDRSYGILKTIGVYSAILATFSLGMVLYAPRSMSNWPIWYPCSCLCLFGIVYAMYYFSLKESPEAPLQLIKHLSPFGWCFLLPPGYCISDAFVYLRESEDDKFPKIYYVGLLVPISLVLVLFVPNNLHDDIAFLPFFLFHLIIFLKMFPGGSIESETFAFSKETITRIVLRRSRYTCTYEIVPED